MAHRTFSHSALTKSGLPRRRSQLDSALHSLVRSSESGATIGTHDLAEIIFQERREIPT